MSAPDRIDFDGSRAVLIGISAYTEGLEPMPAAANSLKRMEDLLVGLCGWPSSAVTSFMDLSTGDRRFREVNKLIEEATDVLLLYYVGHGLMLAGDDLGLALTDTDTDPALHLTTTYRLRTLREQLRYHCNARLKLTILDCCFAGIATKNAQGPDGLADRVDHASRIEGAYTWTASRALQQAVYEDGDGGLTYFTKTLHEVVASGIPGESAWLTLADVDHAVAQRFRELPLPNTTIRPEQTRLAAGGLPGMFPFTPNRAFTPRMSALVRECLLRPPQPERLFLTQPDLPEDAQGKEARKARDTHQLVELEELIAVWQWGDSWLRSRPDSLAFTSHGIRIIQGRRRLYIPYREFHRHTFSCEHDRGYTGYAVNQAPGEYLVIKGPSRWKSPRLGKPLDTHLVAEDLNRIKEIAASHPGG
jgi:hypothetical protein